MRTKIIMALAFAAAMASCSKDEVTNTGANISGKNLIGFASYSNQNSASKGPTIDENSDFAVSGQEFTTAGYINLDGTKVEYLTAIIDHDGTKWDYKTASDAEFWPSDASQTIDFYAFANNAADVVAISATGIDANDYTIPATIAAQKDFLYADALAAENVTPSANVADGVVTLEFKHALTQINVTAEVTVDDYKLDIDEVTFHNVNSMGTMAYPLKTGETRIWGNQKVVTSYTIANKTNDAIAKTDPVKAVDIDDAGGELILLPQTFAAWDGASSVYTDATNSAIKTSAGAFIMVKCTMWKEIGGKKVYYIGDKNGAGYTAIPLASVSDTGETPDATSPEWKDGRNITYNLQFGPDPDGTTPGGGKDPETGEPTLVPIQFTANVANWVDLTPSTDVEM